MEAVVVLSLLLRKYNQRSKSYPFKCGRFLIKTEIFESAFYDKIVQNMINMHLHRINIHFFKINFGTQKLLTKTSTQDFYLQSKVQKHFQTCSLNFLMNQKKSLTIYTINHEISLLFWVDNHIFNRSFTLLHPESFHDFMLLVIQLKLA